MEPLDQVRSFASVLLDHIGVIRGPKPRFHSVVRVDGRDLDRSLAFAPFRPTGSHTTGRISSAMATRTRC